jgi:preprotein translocase subunit YajC
MSSPFFATTMASAAAPGGGAAFFVQILPLLFVFIIFYFLMIRPQQRRMKDHAATIGAVQKGDEVVTAGGIRGKVTKVADDEVEVEIAQGIKVRVIKSTLSNVLSKTAKPAND